MTTDRSDEINALKAKQEKAQTALTQAQTRRESLEERKAEVVAKMEAMGVTPENAEEKLAKLIAKRDELLAEAKEVLDGVQL